MRVRDVSASSGGGVGYRDDAIELLIGCCDDECDD